MSQLFAVGCIIITIFIIYNVICYKNKKIVYMINDKYIVLNTNYYKTQLIFGLCNSISLFLFYLVWYFISQNPSIFLFGTIIIFWGLNYLLKFYSIKKLYIGTKE